MDGHHFLCCLSQCQSPCRPRSEPICSWFMAMPASVVAVPEVITRWPWLIEFGGWMAFGQKPNRSIQKSDWSVEFAPFPVSFYHSPSHAAIWPCHNCSVEVWLLESSKLALINRQRLLVRSSGSFGGAGLFCFLVNAPFPLGWVGKYLFAIKGSYLVDPASSHMLVSKIKPCMSKYKQLYSETANGSLNQL